MRCEQDGSGRTKSVTCRAAGRPRDLDLERRILDVTLRLLAEQGFSRLSIEGIAAAAAVGKPTIYRRWSGKADLATAALTELRLSEAPVEAETEVDRVRGLLQNFRRSLLRPNGMALIGTVLAEEERNPEFLRLFRERVVAPRRRMVSEALAAAHRAGEVAANLDVEAVTTLLIGSFYARYLAGDPISAEWVDRIVAAALGGSGRV